jgi:glycosyltransferase involved in cell wall biosynthesis
MAMSKPVVVSERRTLSDYVTRETALTVPAEDSVALARAIDRVLADAAFARTLATAARRRVEYHFTSRKLAGRLAPVIRTAGSARAAGPASRSARGPV